MNYPELAHQKKAPKRIIFPMPNQGFKWYLISYHSDIVARYPKRNGGEIILTSHMWLLTWWGKELSSVVSAYWGLQMRWETLRFFHALVVELLFNHGLTIIFLGLNHQTIWCCDWYLWIDDCMEVILSNPIVVGDYQIIIIHELGQSVLNPQCSGLVATAQMLPSLVEIHPYLFH